MEFIVKNPSTETTLLSFSFWQSSLYLTWTAFAVEGVVEDVVVPATFVSFAGLGVTRSFFEQAALAVMMTSIANERKNLESWLLI